MNKQKEQFDEIMNGVKQEKMKTLGVNPDEVEDLDKTIDDMEKEFDKSMGETKVSDKHTMTIDQYNERTMIQGQRKLLEKMVHSGQKLMSDENREKLLEILDKHEKGEINDPVMIYLLKQRAKSSAAFDEAVSEMKRIERKLLDDLAKHTNTMVVEQGTLAKLNQQILEIYE